MLLWKMFGVAGLASVAAAGVIIARDKRQRAQLTPEEIRARLLKRYEEVGPGLTVDARSGGVNRPDARWLDRLGGGGPDRRRPGGRR